jgi:Domain of unknown function (DUF397)
MSDEITGWRKSTRCDGGACVEVGQGGAMLAVRDTKNNGSGPVLTFPAGAWKAFTAALKADDRP